MNSDRKRPWKPIRVYGLFRKGLFRKLTAFTLLISVIPLLIIGIFTYYFSGQTVEKEFIENSDKNLVQLSENIDANIRQMEIISLLVLTDNFAQESLRRIKNLDYVINNDDTQKVRQLIVSMTILREDISGIYICAGKYLFFNSRFDTGIIDNGGVERENWYRKVIEQKGSKVLFPTHEPFYKNSEDKVVFSLSRAIFGTGTDEFLGVVVIDSNFERIRSLCEKNETQGSWVEIVDPENKIIYSTDETAIGSQIEIDNTLLSKRVDPYKDPVMEYKGQQVFMNFYLSDYTGWKVLQFTPVNSMTRTTDTIGRFILNTALVCIFIAVVLSLLLVRNVTKPIANLNNIIKNIGKGNFEQSISVKRTDEIGQLASGVKEMMENLRKLDKMTSISRFKQKEAELKALQNQINPHFLYNTLESIHMKAVLNRQKDIAEMVSALGNLFKLSISKGREIVKFRQELEHVEEYAKIQTMRYADKIRYSIRFDENLREFYTLKLIFQPIVENAIFHGFERMKENGYITISGKREQNEILVKIEDNGIGIEKKELEKIQTHLDDPEHLESKSQSIGLKNVNDRIKLYFGEQYGLKVQSEFGTGTTVLIVLPVITNPEDFETSPKEDDGRAEGTL